MGKFGLYIWLFFAAAVAQAESLENFPGWSIDKIVPAASDDGSYSTGPDFYSLSPPDKRPAVSIDGQTASLLRTAQRQAEEVYNGLTDKKTAEQKTADNEYVYAPTNRGFVIADNLQLPQAQEVKTVARSGGGFSGFSGSASSHGGAGTLSSPSSQTSGASMAPSSANTNANANAGAEAAAAAGANSGAATTAAAGVSTPSSTSTDTDKNTSVTAGSGGGATTSGTVMGNKIADGMGFTEKDKKTAANGNLVARKPGSADSSGSDYKYKEPLPPCEGARIIYDKAVYQRVTLPKGCGIVYLMVWGAGGGEGIRSQTAGGRDGQQTVSYSGVSGRAANFSSSTWEVDSEKFDLIVVVGATGTNAGQTTTTVTDNHPGGHEAPTTEQVVTFSAGAGGFPGGGNGSGAGGGGGGYSAVYLVPKSDGTKTLSADRVLSGAAGGSGGGSGGGGGNVGGTTSLAKQTNIITESANGSKPGYYYHPDRGNGGSPGVDGRIILQYF